MFFFFVHSTIKVDVCMRNSTPKQTTATMTTTATPIIQQRHRSYKIDKQVSIIQLSQHDNNTRVMRMIALYMRR